jgi:hypothetical protein
MNTSRRKLGLLALSVAVSPTLEAAERPLAERIRGIWRSDRQRTLERWVFAPYATEEAKHKIASWFGRFTYTFSSRRLRAEFDGGSWEARYRVASASENTLALVVLHAKESESLTLYVDEPFFAVRVGTSQNFEYFRRHAA